jgi:hypothetical protein
VLSLGDAFLWDGHVWFILSEPRHVSGKVLCVNLTTLDEECPDDECVLDNPDYGWIDPGHLTAVAFSRARVFDARKVEESISSGLIRRPRPNQVPAATMAKIVTAAKASKELSAEKRRMLP